LSGYKERDMIPVVTLMVVALVFAVEIAWVMADPPAS
jgi:hypothetical protein